MVDAGKEIQEELKNIQRQLREYRHKDGGAYIAGSGLPTQPQPVAGETWTQPAYESYPEAWRYERKPGGKELDYDSPLPFVSFTPSQDWEFIADGHQIALKAGMPCVVPQRVFDDIKHRLRARGL